MDTNEKSPRENRGGENNGGGKKPYHKHHHHRRPKNTGDHSNQQTEQNSPNGAINVRPGRYDVPPTAEDRASEKTVEKPASDANAQSEDHAEHKSRRPRRPRHRRGNGDRSQNRAGNPELDAVTVDEISEESAPAISEESTETDNINDIESDNGGSDSRRRRRSRGSRRRGGRNRDRRELREEELEAEADESSVLDEMTDDSEAPTYSEYITTAGGTDAEVIEELNSISAADAESLEPSEPEPELQKYEIIGVRFKSAGKIYYFDPNGETFKKEDAVIVETSRGLEFGLCDIANRMVTEREVVLPLRAVVRRATEEDIARHEENVAREKEALEICTQKILDHDLKMKLIDVEYTFDNSKLLFYFTAEGRVDFRELVKDLAAVFRTRIELRQIGIRDETKLLGGIGICGRPFCCKTFLSDFVQVSIKMAKEQNLSLNSAKISGACGRLMCCLRYEYDTYQEEIRRTPKTDQIVATPDGDGTVIEVQPLAGLVRVRFAGSDKPPKVFHRDDVKVIGGKGVKNKDSRSE